MWLTWDEINARLVDRKLVFFGAGNRMERTRKYLSVSTAYIIDNNFYEQHSQARDPKKAYGERGEIFIVITTVGFIDVKKQLEAHGFVEDVDFCVSPVLKDFAILAEITEHEQEILFTCSDPYIEEDQRGGLYRLSIPSGHIEKLIDGHCHGLAQGDGNIYLVNDSAGGVQILDAQYRPLRVVELPEDARPHGMAYDNGIIAVACSGRDTVYLANGHQTSNIPIGAMKTRVPEHHVNDVCLFDGHLYVSMFSLSGNWKRGIYDGAILEVDLENQSRAVIVSGAWLPHTPTMIGGILHYCESMAGKVWAGTRQQLGEFNGFVRGVARDDKFYYVGQSQHRHITRRLGAMNISLDTGIFILDSVTKCTKFYPTPPLTDINAILVRENS